MGRYPRWRGERRVPESHPVNCHQEPQRAWQLARRKRRSRWGRGWGRAGALHLAVCTASPTRMHMRTAFPPHPRAPHGGAPAWPPASRGANPRACSSPRSGEGLCTGPSHRSCNLLLLYFLCMSSCWHQPLNPQGHNACSEGPEPCSPWGHMWPPNTHLCPVPGTQPSRGPPLPTGPSASQTPTGSARLTGHPHFPPAVHPPLLWTVQLAGHLVAPSHLAEQHQGHFVLGGEGGIGITHSSAQTRRTL